MLASPLKVVFSLATLPLRVLRPGSDVSDASTPTDDAPTEAPATPTATATARTAADASTASAARGARAGGTTSGSTPRKTRTRSASTSRKAPARSASAPRKAAARTGSAPRRAPARGGKYDAPLTALATERPGITVAEAAKEIGVPAASLYPTIHRLEAQRRLAKRGRGLHPA